MSLNDVNKNFAAFGTKTGLTSNGHVNTTESVQVIDKRDDSLLIRDALMNIPQVGDLVDAKTSFNVWYQACVMEVKMVENPEIQANAAVVSPEPILNTSDVEMEIVEETPLVTIVPIAEVTNEQMITSDTLSDTETMLSIEPVEVEALKVTEDEETVKQKAIYRVFIRVTFIGLTEQYDEWIEMNIGKLAKLNSMSNRRRGELYAREEVLFISWKEAAVSAFKGEIVQYRDNTFYAPAYVGILLTFWNFNGYQRLLEILDRYISQKDALDISKVIYLIKAFGYGWRAYTSEFFETIAEQFIMKATNILGRISNNDIRILAHEDVELAVTAIDNITYAYRGRNEKAKFCETFRLHMAFKYLDSPYLNRRLGGLKLLTDIVKKVQARKTVPTGINRVESGPNHVSYCLVPVTYYLTTEFVCKYLLERNALETLLTGVDSHESIILRSGLILRVFAEEDAFNEPFSIANLAQCGLDRHTAILKVFPEFVPWLSYKKLEELLSFLEQLDANKVSEAIVDINFSIASKCRGILMNLSAGSDDPGDILVVQQLHQSALKLLWKWIKTETAVEFAIASLCVEKLEAIVELGTSHQQAMGNQFFPWNMQWIRLKPMIDLAIDALRNHTTIVPSLKFVQSFLYAWPVIMPLLPTISDKVSGNGEQLPFLPIRSSAADFIVQEFSIYDLIADNIKFFKSSLLKHLAMSSTETSKSRGIKLCSSRYNYTDELDILVENLYMLIKNVESVEFPRTAISTLWDNLILNARLLDEFDTGLNFIGKLTSLNVNKTSQEIYSNVADKVVIDLTSDSSALPPATQASFNYKDDLDWIFTSIICGEPGHGCITSPFFQLRSFRNIEKWYRYINAEKGLLKIGKDSKVVHISDDPSRLLGTPIFERICFECLFDNVAAACVSTISTLLQTAMHSNIYRQELLEKCMKFLKDKNVDKQATQTKQFVKRSLLLLEGLIDESFISSSQKLFPHSSLISGSTVTFKITGTSRNTKSIAVADIVLRLNDTIEDLFRAVAKAFKLNHLDIKIFRLGKEVLVADFRKMISQLPLISNEKETLVVAERPNKSDSTIHTNFSSASVIDNEAPGSSVQADEKIENDKTLLTPLPIALKISNEREIFNVFLDLLSTAEGDHIQSLWKVISQLPTAWHFLHFWYDLDCDDVAELTFPLNSQTSSGLSEIVYILQVIEIFVHPLVPIKSLFQQYGSLLNHDERIGTDSGTKFNWCQKFVDKNGLNFLRQAFEWISRIQDTFINQNKLKKAGVNMSLLMAGLKISCKLIRSFLLRGLVRLRKIEYVKFVKSFYDKYEKPNVKLTAICNCTDDESKATIEDEMLSEEWGNQISLSDYSVIFDKLCEPSLYWSCILRCYLLCELENKYDWNTISSSLDSGKDGRDRRLLQSSLTDLLFVWTSIGIANPIVLLSNCEGDDASPEAMSYMKLLSVALLTPDESKNKTSGNVDTLDKPMSESFSLAFSDFIRWISNSYTGSLMISDSSLANSTDTPARTLMTSIITLLLDMRPSIVPFHSDKINGSLVNGDEYSESFQLFKLTSLLIKIAKKAGLPVEKLRVVAESILQELRLSKTGDFKYIKGNVMLLSTIAKLDDNLIHSLFTTEIIDFVLKDILGLRLLHDHSQYTLKLSPESRRYVYEALNAVINKHGEKAPLIYEQIVRVQNSLQPPDNWDIQPEKLSRSPLGFVGLRNLGSTCYMNSLLQVLYMNRDIREYLLGFMQFDIYDDKELVDNIIFQLQKIFCHLSHSEKKYFTPTEWAYAFKDETGIHPVDVRLQQDAQEFLHQLFDRFENTVLAHRQKIATIPIENNNDNVVEPAFKLPKLVPDDILRRTFGGKLCNQMYIDPNPGESIKESIQTNGIKEQEETFVCISVNVENCSSLEDSLHHFVEGEKISDFAWQENKPRVNIIKKQCLSEISDTIIFHLKRFKLNFDTFAREKVNDSLPFPLELTMKSYMKEGQEENIDDKCNYRDASYYQYELVGVVVHSGTSDSGHYFSYLRDADNSWYEFNDAEISKFSVTSLEAECFGGMTTFHEYVPSTQDLLKSEIVNSKNAYILIYDRVKKLHTMSIPTTIDARHNSPKLIEIIENIKQENDHQRLACRILQKDYFEFVGNVVKALITKPFEQSRSVAVETFRFLLNYMAKTPYTDELKTMTSGLLEWVAQGSKESLCVSPPPPPPPLLKHADAVLPPPPPPSNENIDGNPLPPPPPSINTQESVSQSSSAPLEQSVYRNKLDAVSKVVISELLLPEIEQYISALYTAPRVETREQIGNIFDVLIEHCWAVEAAAGHALDAGLIQNNMELKSGAFSASPSISAVTVVDSNTVMEVDDDLALAIKLSQEGVHGQLITVQTTDNSASNTSSAATSTVVHVQAHLVAVEESYDNVSAALKLVLELTLDERLQMIAEHWRHGRSQSFIKLLYQISVQGTAQRALLVHRDLVSQCVDIILGDSSPLCGHLYATGTRKRAPTSYVGAGITSVVQGIGLLPDWSMLLQLLISLLSFDPLEPYTTMLPLSEWDMTCLCSKIFYSTIIKQSRYHVALSRLIELLTMRLSADSISSSSSSVYMNAGQFSTMICEIFVDEITTVSSDNMIHVFSLLQSFLAPPEQDSTKIMSSSSLLPTSVYQQRCNVLFSPHNAPHLNLLHLAASMRSQGKQHTVLVFIRSFIALVVASPLLQTTVSRPPEGIHAWAGWMVLFLLRDYPNYLGINNLSCPPSNLVMFGEEESEKDMTWSSRAVRTYDLLRSLLLSWNVDAQRYLPRGDGMMLGSPGAGVAVVDVTTVKASDATGFESLPIAYATSSGTTSTASTGCPPPGNNNSGGAVNKAMELSDGMTDEELAMYLAASNDFLRD